MDPGWRLLTSRRGEAAHPPRTAAPAPREEDGRQGHRAGYTPPVPEIEIFTVVDVYIGSDSVAVIDTVAPEFSVIEDTLVVRLIEVDLSATITLSIAAIELKPNEKLFFSITIIPFEGAIKTPGIN